METNLKSQEKHSPSPRVSPEKYAKVRWRIKGNQDGDVYKGTSLVRQCKGCRKSNNSVII